MLAFWGKGPCQARPPSHRPPPIPPDRGKLASCEAAGGCLHGLFSNWRSALLLLYPNQLWFIAAAPQPEESTTIDITEPVALTFALRYLNSFAKVGCPCSPQQASRCR